MDYAEGLPVRDDVFDRFTDTLTSLLFIVLTVHAVCFLVVNWGGSYLAEKTTRDEGRRFLV